MSSSTPLPEPSADDYRGLLLRSVGIKSFKQAAVLEQTGDAERARSTYERTIELGDHELASRATYRLGMVLAENGEDDAALAAFRKAAEYGYRQAASWAYYRIGWIFESRRDIDAAQAAFRQADALGHAEAACDLAGCLFGAGDTAGAEAAYRRSDERGSARAALYLGRITSQSNRYSEAISAFQRAAARGSNLASCELGSTYSDLGRYEEAIEPLRRAVSSGDASVTSQATFELAGAFSGLDRVNEAITEYRRLFLADRDYAHTAALCLGYLWISREHFDTARAWFQWVIDSKRPEFLERAQAGLRFVSSAQAEVQRRRRPRTYIPGPEVPLRVQPPWSNNSVKRTPGRWI